MNKVILVGRLTRDPDVRYSQGENSMAVARFTLAVDRRFRRDNSEASADFIGCVAFGKTAEFFQKYTKQGTKLVVEGRIQTGSYQKQDGTRVYTTDVVVENVEFAESKAAASGQQGFNTQQSAPANSNARATDFMTPPTQSAPMAEAAGEGFMQITDELQDEGLPFN